MGSSTAKGGGAAFPFMMRDGELLKVNEIKFVLIF